LKSFDHQSQSHFGGQTGSALNEQTTLRTVFLQALGHRQTAEPQLAECSGEAKTHYALD
jgi:hypothetical protein